MDIEPATIDEIVVFTSKKGEAFLYRQNTIQAFHAIFFCDGEGIAGCHGDKAHGEYIPVAGFLVTLFLLPKLPADNPIINAIASSPVLLLL